MNPNARLMLAFVLCGLIYFVFEIWLRPPLPPPGELAEGSTDGSAAVTAVEPGETDGEPASPTEPPPAKPQEEPLAPPTPSDIEVAQHRIAGDLLALGLTNRTPHEGGVVESIELLSPQFEGHETATDSLGLVGQPTLEVERLGKVLFYRQGGVPEHQGVPA